MLYNRFIMVEKAKSFIPNDPMVDEARRGGLVIIDKLFINGRTYRKLRKADKGPFVSDDPAVVEARRGGLVDITKTDLNKPTG
jgi:hypothetical protein